MFEDLKDDDINFLLTAIQYENDFNRYPTTKEVLELEGYDINSMSEEELDKVIQVTSEARTWLWEQGYLELNKQHVH